MNVTKDDIRNNPGVSPEQIAEVKSQYHFHKLSSVTLHDHTLICTFALDEDPTSLFYTLPESGSSPVRLFDVSKWSKFIDGIEEKQPNNITIAPDSLAVIIGDEIISSEEIWERGIKGSKR